MPSNDTMSNDKHTPEPMTTVERLRALYEAGTKGPWEVRGCGDPRHNHTGATCFQIRGADSKIVKGADDCALTVAMHAALPQLLAVAEAAERIKEEAYVQIRTYTDGSESISFDPHGVNLLGLMKALRHLNAGKKEE